jgi:hypothetical protein
VSPAVVEEFQRIIVDSKICSEVDDRNWKEPPKRNSHCSTGSGNGGGCNGNNSGGGAGGNSGGGGGGGNGNSGSGGNNGTMMSSPETARQELEIKMGNEHIAFTCCEIDSLVDIQNSTDPKGLTIFYYLTQDLKCLVMSLINLHFKIRPIPT